MAARPACVLSAVLFSAACAIRDPRLSGAALPCNSTAQCGGDAVCFLGECRGSSTQLSLVLAEVQAPANQQLGVLQRGGIDLRQSALVDFQLQPLLSASGTVVQLSDSQPVAGARVVLTDSILTFPDRTPTAATETDSTGSFSLTFPTSTWNLLVVPPPPAPPIRPGAPTSPLASTVMGLSVAIPALSQLAQVNGTLPAALGGARVIALDADGRPLSVATNAAADGTFTLELPPQPPPYFLQVGPDPAAAPTDPAIPAFPIQGPFATLTPAPLAGLGALPARVALTGIVVDTHARPVAAAKVLALSLDPTGWTISRQAVTDASGTFTVELRAGQYALEAVPDLDPALPAISGEVVVTVPPAAGISITCPDKSSATGVVIRPDGQLAGAGWQITAMRLPDGLVAGRLATATATDASGAFTLVGDAGHYRLEVVPPAATGLPRKIVSVELGSSAAARLPTLQISAPLAVVGTVRHSTTQAPIAGATVDFFALDASGSRSVLIGSALTSSTGQYTAILPDVPTPTDEQP